MCGSKEVYHHNALNTHARRHATQGPASRGRPRHKTHRRSTKNNHGETNIHQFQAAETRKKSSTFLSLHFFPLPPKQVIKDPSRGHRQTGSPQFKTQDQQLSQTLKTLLTGVRASFVPRGRCKDEGRGGKVINIHTGALISSQLRWIMGTQRAGSGAREPRHSLVHTGGGQEGGARAGREERQEAGGLCSDASD